MENQEDKLIKSYNIEQFERPDGTNYLKRTCYGLNGLEILGLFHLIGNDIKDQIYGRSDMPHIKERIIDKK